ncbi:hypothetical protein Sjap_002959 [Stephania japonica]|uniref:Uncharacterized protein n=1 Tax=Stephania japonica TaxID=461633 RepID=A0AAP0KPK6_9MAGN
MSSQVHEDTQASKKSKNTCSASTANIGRKSANFHPSIWGDYFLNYTSDEEALRTCAQEVEMLKEEVKKMLKEGKREPLKQMNLIDSLQRLGLAYHFEQEIEEAILVLHDHQINAFIKMDDLYNTALYFRLLRQQGYSAPCDIFNKFTDENGTFKSSLVGGIKGLLSLYEAAHLSVHGEVILDDALSFTTTCLTRSTENLSSPISHLQRQVQHALEQPLHRGMPRLEARTYISFYQDMDEKNLSLEKLAKHDFNLVQSWHRKELSNISKWWKHMNVSSSLPFVRDRLVECYFWIVGVYFEPCYSLARIFMTKVMILTSIIDDFYDVYGTLEELQLFADALERWDITEINQLPEYMKVCYREVLNVYNEMEELMRHELGAPTSNNRQSSSYHIQYAKEGMKQLVRAYLIEAKWLDKGYTPKVEEYMPNALISAGYYSLTTTSFVGMGKMVSEEVFEWAMSEANFVRASAIICRLMNDVVSRKFEQERGHVASAMECYMNQYGLPEEEVEAELNKQVEEAWKELNKGLLRPTAFPMPILMRVVNLSRMIYVLYKHEDAYVHSNKKTKEHITSLFVHPIPIS